jgi:shikimate dehydrogenase
MANSQPEKSPLETYGKIGIIGYPVRHSLSPIFQQAAFHDRKLNLLYEIWETPPDKLESVVASMRSSNIYGANVTMPFKETIIPLLDSIDQSADLVGAVNTVVKSEGQLIGHNTDGTGFLEALSDLGLTPEGQTIMIIGAGGAARSIAFALSQKQPSCLIIANRDEGRAINLAKSLKATAYNAMIPIAFTKTTLQEWVPKCDVLINATSIGMYPDADISPIPDKLIKSNMFVYDLVYNPIETVLVKKAKMRGAVATGGLSMLIYQGAHAFTLWTGIPAPRDLMMQTIEAYIAHQKPNTKD